jgi:hypothetical protein
MRRKKSAIPAQPGEFNGTVSRKKLNGWLERTNKNFLF